MNSLRLKIVSLFVFFIAAIFFLGLIPTLTKPTLATASCPTSGSDNCATVLSTTIGNCGPDGKFDVTFNWTPETTTYTPTTQYLDYDLASPMGSAYMVGLDVHTGTATYTYANKFAPNTKYYWRVNTDWSSLGFGPLWSPSVEAYFTTPATCSSGTPSCLVNPTSTIAGQTFNVGGLNFDQANPLHSVSATGYYGDPKYSDLALMSFNSATGAWTATVTMPAAAPSGLYVVRVDSTVCAPNLDVTGLSTGSLSCSYTPATAAPLGSITVTHNGFAEGESIRLFGVDASMGLASTVNSLSGPTPQTTTIPLMAPNGTYNVLIVTRYPITATVCTGGPLVVSDSTTSTPACSGLLDCIGVGGGTTSFTADNLIGEIFTKILPIVLGIAGMITVVMIIISGFQFATSSGNPESAANARGRLTFALVGFAIVALAFALTQIVDVVFLHTSGIF